MDQTQRLDWDDEADETPVGRHSPVGNLHMFAGAHGPAQDFPIYPGPNVIGRHSSCDITLPAQSVSKKHAILNVTGDCHTVCDNGSLNKTRRSKVALEPQVRYALSDGDFLLFADVACRYTIVKKIEVESFTAEESEDDSMLVPGTQATLIIEKTPGAAIRRMGRGAVLARDSGDEDEEVRRGWKDGGEGGSKDVLRTSGPAARAEQSLAADTVVPESDEEIDTSTSETSFPSLHLRCDSDTSETPSRGSSFIPSSLNVFTSPAVPEPAKEESSSSLQISKEKKSSEEKTSLVEKDAPSDSELLAEISDDGPEDTLSEGEVGKFVQTNTLDSGLNDEGTNASTCNIGNENNNLKNDAANFKTPEVSSTSNHRLKDNECESLRGDIAATTAPEINPGGYTKAEEDLLKPIEKDIKVEANLCLDSDTDSDEEIPTTSGKDDLETKSVETPEQSNNEALGTSDAGVNMTMDTDIDEDKNKMSAVQHGQVGEINIDSDTDVEDDTEVLKTECAETSAGNGDSSEVPKVDTISKTGVTTSYNADQDTDVEDADITGSDDKKVDQEPRTFVEEKKKQFHMDSDTDVEDEGDVSSTKVRKGDSDSIMADVSLKEIKDGIHLDSDTDVEEDVKVSSTHVTKEKQDLNIDIQGGFHVDSDTDVEDVDVSSTVVSKGNSSNSVQETTKCPPLDSDTDVDEENQRPGTSTAAMQSKAATGQDIDDQQLETVKNVEDVADTINRNAADPHFSSDTDVDEDDGTSAGPGPKIAGGLVKSSSEENEAEAGNEAAALHIDSDTDVDEDDASLVLDKSRTVEGELHSDGISEGGDGNLDKVSGSSGGKIGEASEVPGPDTSAVSVESSEEETQKIDPQDADYELMATQCYLDPQGPESDLADEEEATQAYILSSTWAEPDPFKRPSDPVRVLQISAVTLDKSDDEVDEYAVAETQLFCLEADQSPGPRIAKTLQEDTQPCSSGEESRTEAQEPTQGTISQEDTEPVSQCLSTKPETGTWKHLKRDVPVSVWMKDLQQKGETSNIEEDLTQDELDLPPLELEATQSYILETPNVQEPPIETSSLLALQDNPPKLSKSAVPGTADPPTEAINLEPGVLGPASKSSPIVSGLPERDVSIVKSTDSTLTGPSVSKTDVLAVPSTESTSAGLSISKTDVSAVPSTESTSAGPCISETNVLAVPSTESTSAGPCISKPDVSAVPSTESTSVRPSISETCVSTVPANEDPPSAPSIPEMGESPAPLTEGPSSEHTNLELSVSAVPASENPSRELSNMETQVTDDDATQAFSQNLPVDYHKVTQSNLQVPSTEDATQPCSLNVEFTASIEAQSRSVSLLTTEEEKNKLLDTGKGKPASRRGLSRSRKKEQPEKSTEIVTEKAEQPEPVIPAAPDKTVELGSGESNHSIPSIVVSETKEETVIEKGGRRRGGRRKDTEEPESKTKTVEELGSGESDQSIPSIVVSETKEETVIEKGGRRRGGRRKDSEEPESKTKTVEELVAPRASRSKSSKVASEAEPSTSGITNVQRKKPSRKSVAKMQEEKKDEAKEDFGTTSEKCRDSDVSEVLSENHSEKIDGLRSKAKNVIEPASMEMGLGHMDRDQEVNVTSTALEPSEDKIVSTITENDESRILDLPEQSETISPAQNKKPVRGKRRAATKEKQGNAQEAEPKDVEDKAESATSGTPLEKQGDFKMPTPKTSDSQDGGQEGTRGRRTRRSNVSNAEPLEQEERKDTKASQNEEANKTTLDDLNSGSKKSARQRRNVKEEVKENSQKEEQLPSKRAISLKGDPKNKDKSSQQILEDNPDSSPLSKRTRKNSKEETPNPEQEVTEVGKAEEESTVRVPRRTRGGFKEEQKTVDNEGSLESSSTAEAKTTKRTRSGSREQPTVSEETVKETVTRKRRNSKVEDSQLGEDQSKKSVRTRRASKNEVVEETNMITDKEDTAGQNTSRRARRTVKTDEKAGSGNVGDLKPDKELSQSDRSSSRTRRKASAEDNEKMVENTEELSESPKNIENKELPVHETPRRGRPRKTSVKEELPQVSTPVTSRTRGQSSKVEVETKRKKSDETQEAEEEIPAVRRGRTRKLSTDDSQTSAGGREMSTPEPSPSRSSRQRQGAALSIPAEVRTPRRTGRSSTSTLTASPYIPQSGALPKVLFTGVVDATGEEIIRSLGGDIADSVFDCTHLITDRVRRTVKFLCALARGVPIVTLDWIDKCKKSGCFLSHSKFLVKDKEQEKNFNFVLSESLQKAKRGPLFEGYEIHVTASVKPDPALMKDIICCSGATFLAKMPRTFKEKCVIVSCAEDAARCKSVPSRIPVTTVEFILSGILRQEVDPGAYLLSNAEEDSAPAPAKRRR